MPLRALVWDLGGFLASAVLAPAPLGITLVLVAASCNTYDPSLLTASANAEGQEGDDDDGPMPVSAVGGEGGEGPGPPAVGPSGEGGNAGSSPDVTMTPTRPPPGPDAGGSSEGPDGTGGLAGALTAPTSSAGAGGSDVGGSDSGVAGANDSNAGQSSGGEGGSAVGGGGTQSGGSAGEGAAGASVAGAGGLPAGGAGGDASGGVGGANGGTAGEANGGAGGAVDPDACNGCARLSVPLDASGDQAHFTLTLPGATDLSAAVLTFRVSRVAGSGGSFRAYVQQGTGGSFAYRTSAATPLANISAAGVDIEWDLATLSDFDLTAIARIGIEISASGGTAWTNPTVMQIDRIDVEGGSPAVTSYTFDAASSVHVTPVETYQPGPLWLNSYSADTTAEGSAVSWVGP